MLRAAGGPHGANGRCSLMVTADPHFVFFAAAPIRDTHVKVGAEAVEKDFLHLFVRIVVGKAVRIRLDLTGFGGDDAHVRLPVPVGIFLGLGAGAFESVSAPHRERFPRNQHFERGIAVMGHVEFSLFL